eukprot:PhM_4_TR1246/c1_g1_i1/m.28356
MSIEGGESHHKTRNTKKKREKCSLEGFRHIYAFILGLALGFRHSLRGGARGGSRAALLVDAEADDGDEDDTTDATEDTAKDGLVGAAQAAVAVVLGCGRGGHLHRRCGRRHGRHRRGRSSRGRRDQRVLGRGASDGRHGRACRGLGRSAGGEGIAVGVPAGDGDVGSRAHGGHVDGVLRAGVLEEGRRRGDAKQVRVRLRAAAARRLHGAGDDDKDAVRVGVRGARERGALERELRGQAGVDVLDGRDGDGARRRRKCVAGAEGVRVRGDDGVRGLGGDLLRDRGVVIGAARSGGGGGGAGEQLEDLLRCRDSQGRHNDVVHGLERVRVGGGAGVDEQHGRGDHGRGEGSLVGIGQRRQGRRGEEASGEVEHGGINLGRRRCEDLDGGGGVRERGHEGSGLLLVPRRGHSGHCLQDAVGLGVALGVGDVVRRDDDVCGDDGRGNGHAVVGDATPRLRHGGRERADEVAEVKRRA